MMDINTKERIEDKSIENTVLNKEDKQLLYEYTDIDIQG